jgi:APA family basic amino acid/polyamine antiporter
VGKGRLGLWTGVGVNVGTMIGVGVFVSAGFMADTMGPGLILMSWLVGGVLAVAGARAYAAVAAIVPRSGGEYRYLSELFHPWLGMVAGWTSLFAGFAAPVASAAATAGPFMETLFPALPSTAVGVAIIAGITLLHAFHHGLSKGVQDALALAKVVLLFGFIAVGLVAGSTVWPEWRPQSAPQPGPVGNFMAQLVWVMYAYTGWNSAVYAAEEFRDPRRTVPRSMMIAAVAVMVCYLAVNWVLVANLTPDMVTAFLTGDKARITLGHLVVDRLLGDVGGQVMSGLVVVVLISSVSAMTMVGPRVSQVMARDGFLPRALGGVEGRPPLLAVFVQGGLALLIFRFHTLREIIESITVLLTMTSALTVATLFKVQLSPRHHDKPGAAALVGAAVYIALSAWMLYSVFAASLRALLAPAAILVLASVAYLGGRWRASRL